MYDGGTFFHCDSHVEHFVNIREIFHCLHPAALVNKRFWPRVSTSIWCNGSQETLEIVSSGLVPRRDPSVVNGKVPKCPASFHMLGCIGRFHIVRILVPVDLRAQTNEEVNSFTRLASTCSCSECWRARSTRAICKRRLAAKLVIQSIGSAVSSRRCYRCYNICVAPVHNL